MDKFGIFNLLTNFLGQKNNQSNTNTTVDNNKQNPSNTSSNNLFQSILSLLNNNSTSNSTADTPTPAPTNPQTKSVNNLPLQNAMLSTMSSHQQFILRVQNKNKN